MTAQITRLCQSYDLTLTILHDGARFVVTCADRHGVTLGSGMSERLEEALTVAGQSAAGAVRQSREKEGSGHPTPLAHLSGKYKDEPLWDDYMLAIEDYRRKANQENADNGSP